MELPCDESLNEEVFVFNNITNPFVFEAVPYGRAFNEILNKKVEKEVKEDTEDDVNIFI
jgi:hypothetical protein